MESEVVEVAVRVALGVIPGTVPQVVRGVIPKGTRKEIAGVMFGVIWAAV